MAGNKNKALDRTALGRNIRRVRKARGLTHAELAYGIGVDERMVYYYETGRKLPSVQVVCAIAVMLGTSVSDLLS